MHDRISLREWINENINPLTAFGIFIGIATVLISQKPTVLGFVLSFYFMSLALLIWLVVISKVKIEKINFYLILTKLIITLINLTIVLFWFIHYYQFVKTFLFTPIYAYIGFFIGTIIKDFKKNSIKKNIIKIIAISLISIVAVIFTFFKVEFIDVAVKFLSK